MEKFNLTYGWYNETIGAAVCGALNSYFENSFDTMLASVSAIDDLKANPLLKNELFYTCRISIKNKQHLTLRITSDFIRTIFHDMFGSNYPVFDLEKLTELEKRILNAFFEYIAKSINKYLIKETEQSKINPLNKDELNLTFVIRNKDIPCGKLGLNMPLNRLAPVSIKLNESFVFDDFINNCAYVDIVTGHSKISLSDLKNLSADDILILEHSDIKSMTLKTQTVVREFKVNPEPSIMLDVEGGYEEEISEYKEENMPESKTMWDDIQIEVSAEFKKVKMSLGELKQISKGLVIDLGSVINNEILLLVENKIVAKGELVIINDKYGVKVNEVYATQKPENAKKSELQTERQQPSLPIAPQPQSGTAQKPPLQPKPGVKPGTQAPIQGPAQAALGHKALPPRPMPQKPVPKPGVKPAAPSGREKFDYSNFEE